MLLSWTARQISFQSSGPDPPSPFNLSWIQAGSGQTYTPHNRSVCWFRKDWKEFVNLAQLVWIIHSSQVRNFDENSFISDRQPGPQLSSLSCTGNHNHCISNFLLHVLLWGWAGSTKVRVLTTGALLTQVSFVMLLKHRNNYRHVYTRHISCKSKQSEVVRNTVFPTYFFIISVQHNFKKSWSIQLPGSIKSWKW